MLRLREISFAALDSQMNGLILPLAFCRLCPADTFLDVMKSSDEKTVCVPCPQANQLSLPGSTSVEDCSDDVTDLNFQIRFTTSITYFISKSSDFIASIAAVLSVSASRVILLESTRRTSRIPKASSSSQAASSSDPPRGGVWRSPSPIQRRRPGDRQEVSRSPSRRNNQRSERSQDWNTNSQQSQSRHSDNYHRSTSSRQQNDDTIWRGGGGYYRRMW